VNEADSRPSPAHVVGERDDVEQRRSLLPACADIVRINGTRYRERMPAVA